MKIQQIRNATLRIEYAGKTFLTDPWLMDKGAMGTFRALGNVFRCEPDKLDIPMPMTALPMPAEDLLRGVDAYICTHVHPDHIDMSPDGTISRPEMKKRLTERGVWDKVIMPDDGETLTL